MVEQKMLIIGELTQGMELATQLNKLDPVQSREACLDLVEKIVSTYDKALSMLTSRGLKREAAADLVETFHQSSDGHTNTNCSLTNNHSKKRKTVARWNEQMRVCSADTGGESTIDDGHRWRKYGQKDILGAKFPRAYYRCTHRNTQGCLATKKVQKTDNDSSSFQISYKGRHTCIPDSISSSTDIPVIRKKISKHMNTCSRVRAPADALFNLQQGLKVETQSINSKEEIFNSNSFTPFTQIESTESVENEFFSKLLDIYSPAYLSPTTSDHSDYNPFDLQLNSYGLNSILQSSESDPTPDHMILTPTSASESPFSGFEFCVDQVDFDTTAFLSEALGYFT